MTTSRWIAAESCSSMSMSRVTLSMSRVALRAIMIEPITSISIRNQNRETATKLSGLRNVSAIESVPHAAHVADIARFGRIGLDFPAQIGDVVVHDAVRRERVGSPRALNQPVAAHQPAGRAHEEREQLEFDG